MLASHRTIRGQKCDYSLAQLVGEGQFAKVYRGINTRTNEVVAVKAMRRSKFSRSDKLKQLLQREMEVLCEFRHPNVIELLELVVDRHDVFLVYEYCESGTLEDKITIEEHKFLPYFSQAIEALYRAEVKGIMHRDIKPANILFSHGTLKVADWGFSRLLDAGQTTRSFIGTPAYMAPEVLKGEEYSLKADVWSLGVVAYESLIGDCPWSAKSISSLSEEIGIKPLHFPQEKVISKDMQMILTRMLIVDAQARPSFKQIRSILNSTVMGSPRLGVGQSVVCRQARGQGEQQRKIVSCVFFLEVIQWSRKNLEQMKSLFVFVRLIEQNLLSLKGHLSKASQIREVWEKELKVVSEMRRKLKLKIARKKQGASKLSRTEPKFSSTGTLASFSSTPRLPSTDEQPTQGELNPEAEWDSLVKQAVKLAIEQLEWAYGQGREKKREQTLIQINVLLDLVLYRQQPQHYLKVSFGIYNRQLLGCSAKSLLRLINSKLLKVNRIYY